MSARLWATPSGSLDRTVTVISPNIEFGQGTFTGFTTLVADDFATEQALLRALPAEPFETGLSLRPRVDRHARVTVRQCQYSVPARYAGRRVTVRLSATTVEAYDGAKLVAAHERAAGRHVEVLALDHYLEVLQRKPGALPGATALVQARRSGVFTATHEAFWAAARTALGFSKQRDGRLRADSQEIQNASPLRLL